jgi:hypothetical protein
VSRIRELLVVAHTHHDIGYTHSPRTILPIHWRSVREAIRLADESAADGRAAFRWTLENARPLMEFLDNAQPGEVDTLARLVRDGRISITGGYVNATQLVGHEELIRSYDGVDRFRRLGLPVHVVQYSDINGLPWGTVPAMARAGLDVLVMGLNPDHGRPPFEPPTAFWWEGPDGSRVLAWLSLHYGLAEMWGLLDGDIRGVAAPLRSVVDRLEARTDYPFDFVVLHATDDNGWPTRHAANGVRAWNELHPELPMTTATMDQAMSRALARASTAKLDVRRGEWADWWAHGHGSSAYEVGVSRAARALVRTAETGLALARLEAGPPPAGERRAAWRRDPIRLRSETEASEAVAGVYDDLLLFEEHTWGADESVSRPDSIFTRSHWNAQAAFAFAAHDAARELSVEAMWRLAALLPAKAGRSLLVFNPGPDPRSGPVSLELESGVVELVARDVPPFGMVRLPLQLDAPITNEAGTVLETERFRIEVDPARGGIVSLVDRVLDWDLVDPDAPEPLGAVIVESVDPTVDHPILRDGRREFRPQAPGPGFVRAIACGDQAPRIERGPGWAAITWSASGPTLPLVRVRATAYDGQDTLRLTVSVAKEENLDPEGVYVAFPFAIANPTFWLETAGAVFRADIDQLPETCRDWYSIQHAAGVTDGSKSVLWTTEEAPLVQLGGIHTGQWAHHLEPSVGHLYAWLMNNLYFTNFKAAQGGSMTFTFGISAVSGGLDPDAIRRTGETVALPLATRLDGSEGAANLSLLGIDSPGVVAVTLALDPDGRSVRVRLQASSRGAEVVKVVWRGTRQMAAWHADVFGHRGDRLAGDGRSFFVRLAPNELATIVIEPVLDAAGDAPDAVDRDQGAT